MNGFAKKESPDTIGYNSAYHDEDTATGSNARYIPHCLVKTPYEIDCLATAHNYPLSMNEHLIRGCTPDP